jgi:hypothetical protein
VGFEPAVFLGARDQYPSQKTFIPPHLLACDASLFACWETHSRRAYRSPSKDTHMSFYPALCVPL